MVHSFDMMRSARAASDNSDERYSEGMIIEESGTEPRSQRNGRGQQKSITGWQESDKIIKNREAMRIRLPVPVSS